MVRRAKKARMDGPEVPVAPMLDMAFQLLTFFVLTYRAAPQEGQFVMSLLPPQAVTTAAAAASDPSQASDLPTTLRTLPVIVRSDEQGRLAQVQIAELEVPVDKTALEVELDRYLNDPDAPFDQAMIKIDPRLRYAELMTILDAFTESFVKAKKEPKLSFDELKADDGG